MKNKEEINKESSKRIFWVIQTIFGFVIARSFYTYAAVFIPPFDEDIFTITIALSSVYITILSSWIDFSYTLIVSPYQIKRRYEKFRFVSDLFIVLIYTYLLVYLEHIQSNPSAKIIEFFVAYALIYFGYIVSGLLRKLQYGKRASRISLISIFFIIFLITAIIYDQCYDYIKYSLSVNRAFIIISIILTIIYRFSRKKVSKRNHTIAIDVDGVLADQITGILPIIEKDFGLKLNYDNITSWNLKINENSIDKIIVKEQNQKNYILNMPVHKGAKKVIDKIIKSHYVVIATARPSNSDKWTKDWMSNNNIPYDRYYNVKEGGKQNADETFDILIDDYKKNIIEFLDNHKTGKAILFSQPWNKDREKLEKYINNGTLVVVESWIEIPNNIKKLLTS